jgi:hypothetical protein
LSPSLLPQGVSLRPGLRIILAPDPQCLTDTIRHLERSRYNSHSTPSDAVLRMAQALDPAAYIFQGTWTNWSRGKVWGLTWTLSPDTAVLVTSALAVFVTLAGIQLWTIVRFTIHQVWAPAERQTATPNLSKQQLILRNASTDFTTARLMAILAWQGRQRTGKISARAVSIACFAVLHGLLFVAAGTFSARAISTGSSDRGNDVLSRSPHCGFWRAGYDEAANNGPNTLDMESLALSVQADAKKSHSVQQSLEYSQNCYHALAPLDSGFLSSTCNTFKRPRLEWDSYESKCPFDAQVCHNDTKAIVLETKIIDTHQHLGINAQGHDRLTYQRKTTCAVLNDTNYVADWNGFIAIGEKPSSRETAYAFYGENLGIVGEPNYTYSYSNFAAFYDGFTSRVTSPYQVDAELAYAITDPAWSVSDFNPIRELQQDSADLTLLFLSFTGKYLEPIHDPWFSALREEDVSGAPQDILKTEYSRDRAISTLGCIEQHKLCTSNYVCTPYLGFDQVQNVGFFNAALNQHQGVTMDRLLRAVTAGSMREVVYKLAITNTPLLASNASAIGSRVISVGLPDDQWKREVQNWHSIGMAQIQRTIAQWSTGQIAADIQFLDPPRSDEEKWFCENFIIPSVVYQSFSIMAIILIVLFGALIIILSLNIRKVASLSRRCFKRREPRKDWDKDDMLRLPGIRESIWKPRPPPKDDSRNESWNSSGTRPKNTEIVALDSRYSSPDPPCDDNSWKRSSSPTLPNMGFPSAPRYSVEKSERSVHLAPPKAVDPDRDSWMAISLSGLDATVPATPMPIADRAGAKRTIRVVQHDNPAPFFQRFKGPKQYHLPGNPSNWV